MKILQFLLMIYFGLIMLVGFMCFCLGYLITKIYEKTRHLYVD